MADILKYLEAFRNIYTYNTNGSCRNTFGSQAYYKYYFKIQSRITFRGTVLLYNA